MALEDVTDDGFAAGSGIRALMELQGLTVAVATGAAADANIAVAGIKTTDTLVSVIQFDTGVPVDLTDEASITSAGNIQCADTNTTGDKLIVVYYSKPAVQPD